MFAPSVMIHPGLPLPQCLKSSGQRSKFIFLIRFRLWLGLGLYRRLLGIFRIGRWEFWKFEGIFGERDWERTFEAVLEGELLSDVQVIRRIG
jgi:hypothetical protein